MATSPSVSPSTSSLTGELVTLSARLVRVVARAAAHEAPAGLRLLSQLDELGPQTVTALARADRSSQPTTSAAVSGLEQRGLVARTANPDDARSTLVALTEAGRSELAQARVRHGEIVARLLREHDLDEEALAACVDVLRRLTT